MAKALFRGQLASCASAHRDFDLGIGTVMGLIMAVACYAAEAFAGASGQYSWWRKPWWSGAGAAILPRSWAKTTSRRGEQG